jgi:hypothetical protein
MTTPESHLELTQQAVYDFEVRFGNAPIAPLVTDEPGPLLGGARLGLARNERQLWRVGVVQIDLYSGVPTASLHQIGRALARFEDFCIVTQSVRPVFPVDVRAR